MESKTTNEWFNEFSDFFDSLKDKLEEAGIERNSFKFKTLAMDFGFVFGFGLIHPEGIRRNAWRLAEHGEKKSQEELDLILEDVINFMKS